jgi:hypothetical protein
MDGAAFDRLTTTLSFTDIRSRRAALGGLLGGALGLLGLTGATAKKRKHKKKKRRTSAPLPAPLPDPTCIADSPCGVEGTCFCFRSGRSGPATVCVQLAAPTEITSCTECALTRACYSSATNEPGGQVLLFCDDTCLS